HLRAVVVQLLVEWHGEVGWSPLPQPGIAGIADDGQQPGFGAGSVVRAVKAVEEPEGSQIRLLHHVFRVLIVECQPARQIVSRAQVWQGSAFKTGLFALVLQPFLFSSYLPSPLSTSPIIETANLLL